MSILRVREHPYKHLLGNFREHDVAINTVENASPHGKTPKEILESLGVTIADASVLVAAFAKMKADEMNNRIEKICRERGITREEWYAKR
jgi:hypothetical protein